MDSIKYRIQDDHRFMKIKECLPANIRSALGRIPYETISKISEIRLRADGACTVTINGENLFITDCGISKFPTRCICSATSDIDSFVYKLCNGSVYSYENSIKQGYITKHGVRTGLCGSIITRTPESTNFTGITSVNIRLPHHIDGCSIPLARHIFENGIDGGGVIIASAPGVGKTTLLRDLAIKLSGGMDFGISPPKVYRVCVVDERNELYIDSCFSGCAADFISGIEKSKAIEFALRVMSPEIIICDEIGSKSDAENIIEAHLGGIAFIASIHASSIEQLISKPTIRKLCEDGIFSYAYILKRNNEKVDGKLIDINQYLKQND